MSYLPASAHADLIANPERMSIYYAATRDLFVSHLGATFANQCEDHRRLAFCAVVAWDLKPYGPSMAYTLRGLMADPHLDCDNYVSLAWHLFYLMRPLSPTEVVAVGWNGGAVGNHAQMQARTPGSPDIFLDPTIGLLVHGCSTDALCRGYPFQPQHMMSFAGFNSRPDAAGFASRVVAAIQGGTYKVSDMIYYTVGLDKWLRMAESVDWRTQYTPQAHKIGNAP